MSNMRLTPCAVSHRILFHEDLRNRFTSLKGAFMPIRHAAFLLLLAAVTACAQFNSAIQGAVTDSSSAIVPGVTARVTNVSTGVSRDVTTGEDGFFRVLSLGAGIYRVEISK